MNAFILIIALTNSVAYPNDYRSTLSASSIEFGDKEACENTKLELISEARRGNANVKFAFCTQKKMGK